MKKHLPAHPLQSNPGHSACPNNKHPEPTSHSRPDPESADPIWKGGSHETAHSVSDANRRTLLCRSLRRRQPSANPCRRTPDYPPTACWPQKTLAPGEIFRISHILFTGFAIIRIRAAGGSSPAAPAEKTHRTGAENRCHSGPISPFARPHSTQFPYHPASLGIALNARERRLWFPTVPKTHRKPPKTRAFVRKNAPTLRALEPFFCLP